MGRFTVYLDQNVLSALQPEKGERDALLLTLRAMADKGAILVYSMLHVEECRASARPQVFVDIIEELSAHLLEPGSASEKKVVLSPLRARELILAERGAVDDAMRAMVSFLKILHFASGWLDDVDAKDLKEEMAAEVETFWTSLEADIPDDYLREEKYEMVKMVQGFPFQKLRGEGQEWQSKLQASLPPNYAQLDDVPAENVVAYIFSRIRESSGEVMEDLFPRKFWSDVDSRQEGNLTGFAFMLFNMGLVRDRRVRRQGNRV